MSLYLGSGIDMLKAQDSRSVDLILTDPPYLKKFQHLYGEMAEEAKRVLKVGGSLVTLCGHYQVLDVGCSIREHLRFWWIGGMTHSGNLNRFPGKWVCVAGKPCLWFVNERRKKGDYQCPIDFLEGGGRDKRFHEWGQPVAWFKHWIERLTEPGEVVCDPFVGGGTVAVAAKEMGRRYLCAEIDPDVYDLARKRVGEI